MNLEIVLNGAETAALKQIHRRHADSTLDKYERELLGSVVRKIEAGERHAEKGFEPHLVEEQADCE